MQAHLVSTVKLINDFEFSNMRRHMVNGQLLTNKIQNTALINAFLNIPREMFMDEGCEAQAYIDRSLPLSVAGRAMMDPLTLATMIQALEIQSTDQVLHVAATTGYGSAILAMLAQQVIAHEDQIRADVLRERFKTLGLKNIKLVDSNLSVPHSKDSPYAAILIEGTLPSLPEEYLELLKHEGRLVYIQGDDKLGSIMVVQKFGSQFVQTKLAETAFPLLPQYANGASKFQF